MFKQNLWRGTHADTCVNKDTAGFVDIAPLAPKKRVSKQRCTECGAVFVHRKVLLDIDSKTGTVQVVDEGIELD